MKSPQELEQILQALEAADNLQTYNKIQFFKPYPKQILFFKYGRTKRERMLSAGNQQGKCVAYGTLIPHPDGTTTKAGVLFNRGRPFDVLSWDGSKFVTARATKVIRKPAEPMVRLRLAGGEMFECALDHRVMLPCGGWALVRTLLGIPPQTNPARDPSTRASSAPSSCRTASDLIARCWSSIRRRGARLLSVLAFARDGLPFSAGAPQRTRAYATSGALAYAGASIRLSGHVRQTTSDAPPHRAAQSAGYSSRDACRFFLCKKGSRRVGPQPLAGSAYRLRSWFGSGRGPVVPCDIPLAGNKIVSYQRTPCQTVYDFTVPGYENYLAHGAIHHNTYAGSAEMSYHLTGIYPDWWEGRRFKKPVAAWCGGVSAVLVRDGPQKLLCGKPGVESAWGTGLIPRHLLVDRSTMRGTTDAYDTVQVRHVSGGISTLGFKSYEQGREKFQAETLDIVWLDEEPPADIYQEVLARIAATGGMIYITFTPLKGRSDVVKRYMEDDSPDRAIVTMTLYDAEHIPPEMRQAIISGYSAHEREARVNGVPMMGEGLIFPYADEMIMEPRIEHIPSYWRKLWSLDFGSGGPAHPFAAVLTLFDLDNDIAHVHHAIRMTEGLPMQHALPIKTTAAGVPVAWPFDGAERERGSGVALINLYKAQGLLTLPTHATWPEGGISTEAGIKEMQERIETGRLKVASHLSQWFEEKRLYHRRISKITGLSEVVKKDDDLMSATRIGLMAKRYAKPVPLGGTVAKRRSNVIAADVDFDLS